MPAIEREALLAQQIDHQVSISDELSAAIDRRDGSWFDLHGRIFDPVRYVYSQTIDERRPGQPPDLIATRGVSIHYLGIATHPECFFRSSNTEDFPKPNETDRRLYAEYIEFYLSITGILNSEEIRRVKEFGWWHENIILMPRELFVPGKIPGFSTFAEVAEKIRTWKKEGWEVALFHGAFDPVTVTHLENATYAYRYARKDGRPTKLVIGFDSDKLIKRKGSDRPRYPLLKRREAFGAFWMVDETVVLNAETSTFASFAKDYLDLGIDRVVTTNDYNEILRRLEAILAVGKEPLVIPKAPLPNATEILTSVAKKGYI